MHRGPGGYWHHTGHTGHLVVRVGSLRVGGDRKSLFSAVGRNPRRTEAVEEDILGYHSPGEVLVAGNPGRNWEGIGCMGPTY